MSVKESRVERQKIFVNTYFATTLTTLLVYVLHSQFMKTQKTKLEMKVERLEKEVNYLGRCYRYKKKELARAREVLRENPHADRRKFK